MEKLNEAYFNINKASEQEILVESADASNPVEDGTPAYKGGNVEHDWASHIKAPPFGESIKKILHHNLTEDGIVEEYYVEHNGKLVGVVAESVEVVMLMEHPTSNEEEPEKEDEEKEEDEETFTEGKSSAHGARPKLIGVPILR